MRVSEIRVKKIRVNEGLGVFLKIISSIVLPISMTPLVSNRVHLFTG